MQTTPTTIPKTVKFIIIQDVFTKKKIGELAVPPEGNF